MTYDFKIKPNISNDPGRSTPPKWCNLKFEWLKTELPKVKEVQFSTQEVRH